MRISRSVMAVGGVVLAAAAIGFTNPKAVHAVTAALVEVTNTASNPVVTQGVGAQAAQIVNLKCPTNNNPCVAISSTTGNPNGGSFQVPANKSLVVTSVDITALPTDPQCGASRIFFLLSALDGVDTFFNRWWVSPNQNYHFVYPTGIVFAPNSFIYIEDDVASCSSPFPAFGDFVVLQGYLTAS